MATDESNRNGDNGTGRRRDAKPARKKRRQRRRRLTDKIRAALARAAALGRRDVTEQLGSLYRARVEEELDRGRQRRARDASVEPQPTRPKR
jgi:hypothetical protein